MFPIIWTIEFNDWGERIPVGGEYTFLTDAVNAALADAKPRGLDPGFYRGLIQQTHYEYWMDMGVSANFYVIKGRRINASDAC